MEKLEKFKLSPKTPYAIELGSFSTKTTTAVSTLYCSVNAIWIKRKNGSLYVCMGYLWMFVNPDRGDEIPASEQDFIRLNTDKRYGGTAKLRWNGKSAFSHGGVSLEMTKTDVPFLDSILKSVVFDKKGRISDVPMPEGYVGWYS